ncbi:hypothetical protein [Chryseobacterium sp. JK1]|uniref:hypothetical protein n=1 Tax=Chryseobacterium sp. JK1 TaxID=874294 RepID=UPI003D69F160
MANGKIETYDEAGRAINLWLKDYCDENLPFWEMITQASRTAITHIKLLEEENKKHRERLNKIREEGKHLFSIITQNT